MQQDLARMRALSGLELGNAEMSNWGRRDAKSAEKAAQHAAFTRVTRQKIMKKIEVEKLRLRFFVCCSQIADVKPSGAASKCAATTQQAKSGFIE